MEVLQKQPYEAPEVEVLEVQSEGIVCASGGPFNNPFPGSGQNW